MRSSVRSAILVIASAPLLVAWSFFDPFHENVEKGNEQAKAGQPDAALQHYDEAARVDPSSPIPDYDRGIVLSGKGEADKALDAFRAAAASEDSTLASDALYNMGNVYLNGKQFAPAIDSYLKSLDLDPNDADARRNLEIALKAQQQQQQQQKQQKKDQKNQDKKDKKDDQQKQQDQQKQDQQQKPQEPKKDEQPQGQNEPPKKEDQQKSPEQQPQPQEDRLSREDAERLLNAVQSDELKVLEQLKQEQQAKPGVVARDW